MIKPYLLNKDSFDDDLRNYLQQKLVYWENNINQLLKDPNLVMLDREDFTNFHVFYE